MVVLAVLSSLALRPAEPTAIPQAQALIRRENLKGALALLDAARSQNPNNPEILYLRGYVLYRLRELDSARAQLEPLTRRAAPALTSRYVLGRIAMLQGRPEEAINWLQLPAAAHPPIEDATAQLGKAYFDAQQLRKAEEWTTKALGLTPWDGTLHYRLARIYQQTGRAELAAREFKASIDLKGADREAVQKLVECAQDLSRGERASALRIRDELLSKPQLDPDVLVALGTSLATAGATAEAIPPFEEATHRDPSLFQAHFDLGLAYVKLGRPAEAIVPLQASLRIAPNSLEANSALASAYVLSGQFQQAVPPLEIVHGTQPDNLRASGLLALAYLRSGAPTKAAPIARALVQKEPGDAKLYFLLIECLNNTNDQAEALAIADEALRRFPDLAKASLAKAQQLARLGHYSEAGPLFLKAAEGAPGDIEPLLGLAEVQNKSGSYAESLATYERALQLDSDNLTAQLGTARDLVSLGEIAKARNVLERAAARHAESTQVHVDLSRVYARLGEKELAAEQVRLLERLRAQQ